MSKKTENSVKLTLKMLEGKTSKVVYSVDFTEEEWLLQYSKPNALVKQLNKSTKHPFFNGHKDFKIEMEQNGVVDSRNFIAGQFSKPILDLVYNSLTANDLSLLAKPELCSELVKTNTRILTSQNDINLIGIINEADKLNKTKDFKKIANYSKELPHNG